MRVSWSQTASSNSLPTGRSGRSNAVRSPAKYWLSCATASANPSSVRSPSSASGNRVGGDIASRTSTPSSATRVSGPIGEGTTVCVLLIVNVSMPGRRQGRPNCEVGQGQFSRAGPPDLTIDEGLRGREPDRARHLVRRRVLGVHVGGQGGNAAVAQPVGHRARRLAGE